MGIEGFETKPTPISRLPTQRSRLLGAAFAELPKGTAMLVPREDRDFSVARGSVFAYLTRRYPTRAIRTQIDREKEGVWVWWNSKEE